MILVHVDEDINAPSSQGSTSKNGDTVHSSVHSRRRPSGISSGWVVMRSLNQVHVGIPWPFP